VCDQAESRGVILGVKPHGGASVYNAATVFQMVEEVNSPNLGVTIDPLHLTRGGSDPADTVLKLGRKLFIPIFMTALLHKIIRKQPSSKRQEEAILIG